MRTNEFAAAVGAIFLSAVVSRAETIRLTDGSILEGQLAEPSEVTVRTSDGARKVAFALLPTELQRLYWPKIAEPKPASTPAAVGPVSSDELLGLANDVNLETWVQVTAIGSFRDKPEKRGSGGLVVTKAFNALDETWVTVYSPKDPVGQAGNWNEQVARARAMQERTPQFMQKRWLELFIKAGEAVARRDSAEFALNIRELKRGYRATTANATADSRNFFTAK
jgi:hypothetical protein